MTLDETFDVTFIVASYASPQMTTECLASLRQHFSHEAVVLVDDGSSEADAYALVRLQSQYRFWLLRQENQGKSAALNLGLRLARTAYIVFCDNDVVFQGRDWLAEHIALLQREPRLGVVGGWGNPDFLDNQGQLYHEAAYWSEPGYCEFVNGGLTTTRTATALAVLRDEAFSACEDSAWSYRLKRAGYVLYLAAAQIEHRMGTNPLIARKDMVDVRNADLAALVEDYKDVLEPRKSRAAIRQFMRMGHFV